MAADTNWSLSFMETIPCLNYSSDYTNFFRDKFDFSNNSCVYFTILCFTLVLILIIVKRQVLENKFETKNSSRIPKASLLLPFRVPIIDGLYHLLKFKRDGVKALEEMSKKFGYFYETDMGPIRTVVVADAIIAQKILCSSEPGHLNKPQAIYGRIFIGFLRDGLVNSEFGTWAPHRKMLTRCFTYKSLQHYLRIMDKQAKLLAKNIISVTSSNGEASVQASNIFVILYDHAMKIIAQTLMGVDVVSEEKMVEFTRNFHEFKNIVLERLLNPQLQFEPYWRFHPKRKEYNRLYSYMMTFMKNLIDLYRKEHRQRVKTNDDEEGKNNSEDDIGQKPFRCVIEELLICDATDKEIIDEIGTMLSAGHETTVVAIKMLLLHLALNPEQQTACRKEIDSLFQEKSASGQHDDDDGEMTMDDLSNLKYLERCILESGRLTSTVPIFIRRLDSPLKIDDLELPAGTNVSFLPWVLHKNPHYFPNPEKFDPDRFLPENVKERHPYAYIPFSGGPRNCIGWKSAIMEIKVIMARILRDFEVFSEDKLEDVKLLFEVTLFPERDYKIILKRRAF